MIRVILHTLKIFILFVICTCLFYIGLRAMHNEYENFHRYDEPKGPAMKVFRKK